MKHKDKWYHDKMVELNNYAKRNGRKPLFNNEDQLKMFWDSLDGKNIKNKTEELKTIIKYDKSKKTIQAMRKIAKENDTDLTYTEIKNMSTRDFAEKNKDAITASYNNYITQGMTSKEASKQISQDWYGSSGEDR
ncbi:MAG: hypothetical protein J6Y28_08675 [Acholeplasmatales bacterium]|nr:hypothetical protein [Acholeplasmatales bacterium]